VLLVDSDVELLNSEILRIIRQFIDEDIVFGGGFINGPCWLVGHEGGYYEERFWVPLVMLKSSMIRDALAAGYSFLPKTVYNDFPPSPFISRVLFDIRFRFSILRNSKIWQCLNPFRRSFHGNKPSWVILDTGAEIHQYLKYRKGYEFIGFPEHFHSRYVNHFQGITRYITNPRDPYGGTPLAQVEEIIRRRLNQEYGFTLP
jgi:hypothetical protein